MWLQFLRFSLGIFLIATPNLPSIASALPIDTFFNLPSPTPTWPKGEGFGKGSIDLGGGLLVSQVTSFNKIWAAYQWGPDNLGVTVFEPSPIPDGFFMLGGYAQPNTKPLFGWVLVGRDDGDVGALKKPIDYSLVWTTQSLNIKQDGAAYFWLPTPPDGYKPVGYVVTNSSTKPSLDKIRCVRSDRTDPCEADSWMWSGNGFNVSGTRPVYRGVEALGVPVGTFVAQNAASAFPISCLKKTRSGVLPCNPNEDQVGALIQAYAPVVYFHPDEEYLPSSVSWFFNNGALLYKAGEEANAVRIDPTGSNLPQGGSNDDAYWLDLPANGSARDLIKKGDLRSAQAYFHVKPMLGGTFTDMAMWVFYPFNGPARIKIKFLNIPFEKLGEHVGDWEHVTLRISNFNGELHSVYFSKHGGGTWMRASELEFEKGNKFVAYASLHGHALFGNAGLVLQGSGDVGLRNDAAKSEKVMDSGLNWLVVASEPAWINYMRQWGPKISYDTASELKTIRKGLIGKLRSAFDRFVKDLPPEALGEAGPAGPKSKSNWGGDEE